MKIEGRSKERIDGSSQIELLENGGVQCLHAKRRERPKRVLNIKKNPREWKEKCKS